MGPINPISTNMLRAPREVVPAERGDTAASQGVGFASGVTVAASVTQVNMVYTEVSRMLSTLGAGLEQDQLLRLMIALMVLNALLGGENGQQATDSMGTRLLQGLAELGGSQQQLTIEAQTSVVQFSQQSTTVYTEQGLQISDTDPEGRAQFDVTG